MVWPGSTAPDPDPHPSPLPVGEGIRASDNVMCAAANLDLFSELVQRFVSPFRIRRDRSGRNASSGASEFGADLCNAVLARATGFPLPLGEG